MSMFPWDDLFYHLSAKEERIQKMYHQYLTQRDTIGTTGDELRGKVGNLQVLMLEASGLLLHLTNAKMTDDDYNTFLNENDAEPPAKPHSLPAIEWIQGTDELVGVSGFGAFVFRFGKLLKAKWFTSNVEAAGEEAGENTVPLLSEDALSAATEAGADAVGDAASTSVTDAAAEAGAEAGTEAALEATGTAIAEASISAASVACTAGAVFVAVGIDMILGAINGAHERDELDKQIDKLQNALDVVDKFLATLNGHCKRADELTLDGIKKLHTAISLLDHIQSFVPPENGSTYPYPEDLDHVAQWLDAGNSAKYQYIYISKVRNDFHNYLQNWQQDNAGSSFTHADYVAWTMTEIEYRPADPKHKMSAKQAKEFIGYVAAHSSEMGKYANG